MMLREQKAPTTLKNIEDYKNINVNERLLFAFLMSLKM